MQNSPLSVPINDLPLLSRSTFCSSEIFTPTPLTAHTEGAIAILCSFKEMC